MNQRFYFLQRVKNPYFIFLPFLLLYVLIVIAFPTNGTMGDENRYLYFAQNLTKGFFSPNAPNIDLGNGPGYPIILMPFVALHIPLICMALLNPILYYLSIVFLFKTLRKLTNFRTSFIFSLFWALFYNAYENIPYILPEIFASTLISLAIFCVVSLFKTPSPKKIKFYTVATGLVIGYLALTKPIFGYVIMFLLGSIFILWLTQRSSHNYRKGLVIVSISLLTTMPYLFYTYHLTGKIFYWSSFGGNNLYWMSSPFEDEYGSWIPFPVSQKNNYVPNANVKINQLHQKDFDGITNFTGIEQDDTLKRIAINNIKSHPIKFLQNCFSNAGRILFNFPYSYKVQKPGTLLRLPMNGFIVCFMLFCLIPTIKNWRKIDFSIRFLLFLALLYLCGSLLGSAETRMFTIIVPVLLVWIAVVISRSVAIKINWRH